MKLFAAILPPEYIIRPVTRMQKGVSGAKWVAPEKLHITTCFFGDLDEDTAEMLDWELGLIRQTGFDVEMGGIGHFGENPPHALWIGVDESEPLRALHQACKRAARKLDIKLEKRKFQPHMTVAYLKPDAKLDRIVAFKKNWDGFRSKPFLVDQFSLISSWPRKTGPNLYRVEATYPLLG